MELQRTFDGQLVPTAKLPDDQVYTECGGLARRADCFEDLSGHYHLDDEDRREVDAEVVHDAIDSHCKWTEEYTENDDYGYEYAYCALEGLDAQRTEDEVAEYIEQWAGDELKEGEARALATKVVEEIGDCDIEAHHQYSEYASYSGSGVCIWSCGVGEVEGHMDIADYDWSDLDDLESILEDYNGDAYLYETTVYNRETGKREGRGYNDRGTITYYANPGGAWHFVIPADFIKNIVQEYLEGCED